MATNNSWNNTVSDADVTLNGGDVNIATDAAAHSVTIGNTTGATAVNVNIGTGDFSLASASGTLISQLDTGEMTQPLQPSFLAYLASDDVDVTGNSAVYPLGTNVALTEIFDQGSDFNVNGTFTAPVTGKYLFNGLVTMTDIDAAANNDDIRINANGTLYRGTFIGAATVQSASGQYQHIISAIIPMVASDTATLNVIYRSGAANDVDVDGSATKITYFAGCLVC